MYDIADNPEFIHRILKKTIAVHMCMLDQIEENGLITTGMDTVHCTGEYNDVMQGYSDDPNEKADEQKQRCSEITYRFQRGRFLDFGTDVAAWWKERETEKQDNRQDVWGEDDGKMKAAMMD